MNKAMALACMLALTTGGVLACGPMFPEELIRWRADAMREPPPAFFVKEVLKLVDKPRHEFPVVEASGEDAAVGQPDPAEPAKAPVLARFETEGLPDGAGARIQAMRSQESGDRAYEAGAGLPEAVRLYTAGAVDFRRVVPKTRPSANYRDDPPFIAGPPPVLPPDPESLSVLQQARRRFEAVLALPSNTPDSRAVQASYSLGRIAGRLGDTGLAASHFRKTRELVQSGLPDTDGLAVASLGEEARLHVKPGELAEAIALYAGQMSYGSVNAIHSLKFVGRLLLQDSGLLDEALRDPLARQFAILYVYTRSVGKPLSSLETYLERTGAAMTPQEDDLDETGKPPHEQAVAVTEDAASAREYDDYLEKMRAEASEVEQKRKAILRKAWLRIITYLEEQNLRDIAGSDWLAAIAYDQGDFGMARRFADRSQTSLAYWIRARLDLRAGRQEEALAAYAQAVHAFPVIDSPPAGDTLQTDDREETIPEQNPHGFASCLYRLNAERGILYLNRGEYVQALGQLYAASARYWADTAYVAERVLTMEELKDFVDHHAQHPGPEDRDAKQKGETTPTLKLRHLLARRLMRTGRTDEAIAYFDDEGLRGVAREYQQALARTASRWRGPVGRARAWFQAATLARTRGMELMGYELAPDYAIDDGAYYGARGPGPRMIHDPAIPAGEQNRFDASRAAADLRFHYRRVAAEHAVRAADLLPHSSQAFAAVLCQATKWTLDRQPRYAHALYRRYLDEGPYVTWGKKFGQQCPAPDFSGAEWRLWAEPFGSLKNLVLPGEPKGMSAKQVHESP